MDDQQQLRLFDHLEIPPILLMQDPRIDYIVRVQVLQHPTDGGSYLLHCHFDSVTPQAWASLRSRLRIYAFGQKTPALSKARSP